MPLFQHKLKLLESDNTNYYNFFREYNELTDRHNKIQKQIQAVNCKIWNYWSSRKKLKSIRPEVSHYIDDYLKWKYRVDNFVLNPEIMISEADYPWMTFQHYIDNLRDIAEDAENHATIISGNFNSASKELNSSLNFTIAILSFILSFIGLVVTLIAIFKKG